MLTAARIEELANRKNVRTNAVLNFLGTLGDMTYSDALANLRLDARSYKWNAPTQKAIQQGLKEHFGS